tara:strand:+ start:10626 stop:11018 length:393 start_codon:yes stop_codon:yes gene_type:complete
VRHWELTSDPSTGEARRAHYAMDDHVQPPSISPGPPTNATQALELPPKKKQKRNKPTLSCEECVERKTKVSVFVTSRTFDVPGIAFELSLVRCNARRTSSLIVCSAIVLGLTVLLASNDNRHANIPRSRI